MKHTQFVFRFRDLVAETITEHKEVIETKGSVWWGWWKRPSEDARGEVWDHLSKADQGAPIKVILFDSGNGKTYEAVVVAAIAPVGSAEETVELPKGQAEWVPQYYRKSPFSRAWMKITQITPLNNFWGNYSFAEIKRLPGYSKAILDRFTNKKIINASELRGMDTTIWEVRPSEVGDHDEEIILSVNAIDEAVSQETIRCDGDTEHPGAILEIESVRRVFPGNKDKVATWLEPALIRFEQVNAEHLTLYAGVEDTLEAACSEDIVIVGYTDARVSASLSRVNSMGLRKYFSGLFTPDQKESRHPVADQDANFLNILPYNERKPNPLTLLDICNRCGVAPYDAIYVGDSLTRDIFMAREAGVLSAWAKYGTRYDTLLWQKLVAITHWTPEDVKREAEFRERAYAVSPDIVLEAFSDLAPVLIS